MGKSTAKKLSYLKEHVDKNFPFWTEQYGSNIVGAHVGYKEVSLKPVRRYSIVFHVRKKHKNPKNFIPKNLELDTSDLGKINVPTDILEVGPLVLESSLGSDVKPHSGNWGYGSVGFYGKRNGHYYVCSNMHVVGAKYVKNGMQSFYRHPANQSRKDVKFNPLVSGYLEEAYFDSMDVGIVRIDEAYVDNYIPRKGAPRGIAIINLNNVNYFKRLKMSIYGARSGLKSTKVLDVGINKYFRKGTNRTYLTDLIRLKKCSQKGDSGSPVFIDNSMKIIGIIVGSDRRFSYAIPIKRILNRFNLEFVT